MSQENQQVTKDLENEVKRLKSLIDKAPHDVNCEASQYRGYLYPQPCNCWKSQA